MVDVLCTFVYISHGPKGCDSINQLFFGSRFYGSSEIFFEFMPKIFDKSGDSGGVRHQFIPESS